MNYLINYIITLCLFFNTFNITKATAQVVTLDANYKLVFDENFSGTALDTSQWRTCYNWGQLSGSGTTQGTPFCSGHPNLPWDIAGYPLNPTDTNNVKVNNNTIKLVGKKETYHTTKMSWPPCPSATCTAHSAACGAPYANPGYCFVVDTMTFQYSNGMLESTHKYLYGYYEMKWRVPGWVANDTNNVTSPTFWLFGGDTLTAKYSEIDFFEIDGRYGDYLPNVHVIAGNNPNDTTPTNDLGVVFSNKPTVDLSQWHTSGALWTPDSIVFYLDGTAIDITTRDTNKYLVPMQIIIEDGLPALNFCGDSINNSTPMPTFELDYVKIWQPVMACDTNKTYVTGTQSNYISKHYESLTLGGTGGNFVYSSGNGLGRGVDYVLLDQGTEISGTGTFQADVLPCWQKMPSYKTLAKSPAPMPPNFLKILSYARKKN